MNFPKINLDKSFSSLGMCKKCRKVSPNFVVTAYEEEGKKHYVHRICHACVSLGKGIETLIFDSMTGKFVDCRK